MAGIFNKITELFAKLRDKDGNGITSTLDGSKRLLDVNAQVSISSLKLEDKDVAANKAKVDALGNIYTKTEITNQATVNIGNEPTVIQKDGNYIKLVDGSNNTYFAEVTSTGKLKVSSIIEADQTIKLRDKTNASYEVSIDSLGYLLSKIKFDTGANSVKIEDSTNASHKGKVDSAGFLYTKSPPPSTPPGLDGLENNSSTETVTKMGGVNEFAIALPDSGPVTLTAIFFTGWVPTQGVLLQGKCELYYQPVGTTVGEELIKTLYLQHGSYAESHLDDYTITVGGASSRLVMRITNQSQDDAEFYVETTGYY